MAAAAAIAVAGCSGPASRPTAAGPGPPVQRRPGDGNLLISGRLTWTVYKVSLRTGKIIWELGGKQSMFTLKAAAGQVLDRAGEIFAYQHDPEAIGNDEYTVFDDESDGGSGLLPYSRAVTVQLGPATRFNAQILASFSSYRACRLPWPAAR